MSKSVKFVKIVSPIAFAITLSACGGSSGANFGASGSSGNNSDVTDSTDVGSSVNPTVVSTSSIDLSVSSPLLFSDGSAPITITAIAKDQNNNAIEGAIIHFSVDKEATIVKGVSTGSIQTATLTPGSSANRTLNITVVSGEILETISVDVIDTPVDALTEVLASSIELSVSSRQLPSDGSAPITITAIAKDRNNNAMDGASIVFSVDKDATIIKDATVTSIEDSNDTTAATLSTVVTAGSIQTATLTPGSSTNQTLNVMVTSGSVSKTISVEVVGTTVAIEGPSGITAGKDNPFLLKLKDSSNNPIAFQYVDLSALNSTITDDSNRETNAEGEIAFNLNSSVGGTDTISASVLGANFEKIVEISSDEFILSSGDNEINIETDETISFIWKKGGVAQPEKTIVLSATRGDILNQSINTSLTGEVNFVINSKTAGKTVISATSSEGLSTSLSREFVATTPSYLNTQASPTLISPNTSSTIIAKIRDRNDNPVKNKIIDFRLNDTVDGTLSASTATTDSLGRASVSYTAGNSSSATNGVKISTFIQGYPSVAADSVELTVGGNALRLVLGEDQLLASDAVFYIKKFGVIVTDSAGNPIPEKQVSFTINPTHYYKGFMRVIDSDGDGLGDRWIKLNTINTTLNGGSPRCISEDFDQDGNLDISEGEDINGNGKLEPTNDAVVTVTGKTDVSGKIVVEVTYPKSRALWSRQKITARTQVDGTEFVESTDFDLPILAADVEDVDTGTPNSISPYGISDRCDNDSNSYNLAVNPKIVSVLTGLPVNTLSNNILYQVNFVDVLGNDIQGQNFVINSSVVDISKEPNNSFRLTDKDTDKDDSGYFIELVADGTVTPLFYQDDTATNTTIDPDSVVTDVIPPIIALNGSASILLNVGEVYVEAGANAIDIVSGVVDTVDQLGTVDIETAGVYTLIYIAKDASGNASTVIRTVTVVPSGASEDTADAIPPIINLTGSANVVIPLGSAYAELGANAVDDIDGVVEVTIVGTVNTTEEGTYTLIYIAKDGSGNRSILSRNVSVDGTPPVITLRGNDSENLVLGSSYIELGASAIDSVDGPVLVSNDGTVVDTDVPGVYTITYTATDSAGNRSTTQRTVTVDSDRIAPQIEITGGILVTHEARTNYSDAGALAIDSVDGNITADITVGGDSINAATAVGSYQVSYDVSDSSGNAAQAIRTVNVVDTTSPVITSSIVNQTHPQGTAYSGALTGILANDTYDGDLTSSITVGGISIDASTPIGPHTITYDVQDAAGNATQFSRTVTVE